ncbi:putative membrane-bound dehydrogenase domain-containing protein [Prosthecobacter debontii]|uniref:Putative membrane-bound dehydrogenase domain-containing protein n=1 Tax=Prosthecobacter debontii TaxID=48467 RepID=A0A1T4WJN6_9BACT|nr:PVC-type heme-binding CxxCH protein [Prosthecobacter debontii]SKA77118.1 putative membrane-bound dehydrogenase domain-containing protein [Prosthecobacter debontii]
MPSTTLKKTALVAATAGLLGLPALALHEKNAGPTEVEIKFNLPPPEPLSPEEALKTFKVEKGFKIELVAAEPMIEAPIAVSFDDQGRLYVVEMRGYMRDKEGTTEGEATGRIKLLEDTDGDGRMDKDTVFVDELVMPRSVMAVNGGALVAVPPNLFFYKDSDGDGKADVKEVIATDYGTAGGQPEHMANTPTWAMDNSIWSAGYATRFRLRGGVWLKDSGLGRGQYGLCQDDQGRLYFNYNSDLLRCDLLPTEAFGRNPLLRNATSINFQVAKDQTVWPSHPTPGVNRGYDPKSLREDGTLTKATATCGALIYRGEAYPASHYGNAFIPEPSANIVKRMILTEKDGSLSAKNAVEGTEFLTSTDERFRPVQAVNAPDGVVYIVDMYRGIIQHSSFLTHYLIANIEARKLDQPFDQGRIWRIVPEGKTLPAGTKIATDTAGRIAQLSHANGWVRDTAQRLLVESSDAKAAPALAELVQSTEAKPLARLHALWTLDGLGMLTPDVLRGALKDSDVSLKAAAVRLAGRDLAPELLAMTGEKAVLVQAQLAIKLTSFNLPDADAATAKLLALGGGKNALVAEGAMTGLRGREAAFAGLLTAETNAETEANTTPVFGLLGNLIASANKAQLFEEALAVAAAQPKGSSVQRNFIKALSTTGSGKNAVKPKLLWLDKEPESLATLKKAATKTGITNIAAIESRLAWVGKKGAPPPPKIVPLTEAQQARFEKGKIIYAGLCAACHQPHGFGLDGLAPPLVDSEWVLGKPDVPARIVLHGLGGPVKVSGRTWNLSMPPLPHLTDEDIASVLTYLRREWEHNASPVEPKTITELRAQYKEKAGMWTAEELNPPKKK